MTDKKSVEQPADMNQYSGPPVVPIVGYSGSGKTTVLVKLIAALTRKGFQVGTIKHHSHELEMDIPGKDTWRHKQSGAVTTLISSPNRIGLVRDVKNEMALDELILLMPQVDVIMVEGYKRVKRPKIEVFRPEVYPQPACEEDDYLVALISDTPVALPIPRFSPGDIDSIVDFIVSRYKLSHRPVTPEI